jgi:hypothetical protein
VCKKNQETLKVLSRKSLTTFSKASNIRPKVYCGLANAASLTERSQGGGTLLHTGIEHESLSNQAAVYG